MTLPKRTARALLAHDGTQARVARAVGKRPSQIRKWAIGVSTTPENVRAVVDAVRAVKGAKYAAKEYSA